MCGWISSISLHPFASCVRVSVYGKWIIASDANRDEGTIIRNAEQRKSNALCKCFPFFWLQTERNEPTTFYAKWKRKKLGNGNQLHRNENNVQIKYFSFTVVFNFFFLVAMYFNAMFSHFVAVVRLLKPITKQHEARKHYRGLSHTQYAISW